MSVLAIIPARGGSKGIPRKNLVKLGGIPLIAWSIRAAQSSPSVDTVFVSTEDEEIASVAREWGAEVPFLRPQGLSGDRAIVSEAIEHALGEYERMGKSFTANLTMYPTQPFRTPDLVEQVAKLCLEEALWVGAVQALNVNLGFWLGHLNEKFEAIRDVRSHSPNLLFKDSGLIFGRALLPKDLKKFDGAKQYLANAEQIAKGDKRFLGGAQFLKISNPVMLTDVDTPKNLEDAERHVKMGAPPWFPDECNISHSRRSSPRGGIERNEFVRLYVSPSDTEVLGRESVLIELNELPSPKELRTLVDTTTSFKDQPVVLHSEVDLRLEKSFVSEAEPKLVLNKEKKYPVCAFSLYERVDYSILALDEETAEKLCTDIGTSSVKRENKRIVIELKEAPKDGDEIQFSLWGEGPLPLKVSGIRTFSEGKWDAPRSSTRHHNAEMINVECTDRTLAFEKPSGAQICAFFWNRATSEMKTSANHYEYAVVPGWIGFDSASSTWTNELTGQTITGRHDIPPMYHWKNIASLPSRVAEEASWSAIFEDE